MTRDIPDVLKARKNALYDSTGAWVWLVELYPNDAEFAVYLTDNSQDVTFPESGGNIYRRYPLAVDPPEENTAGDLTAATLVASNVTGEAGSFLEHYDGMRGDLVILRLVHTDHLDATANQLEGSFTVRSSTVDHLQASLELAHSPLFDVDLPYRLFDRSHCPFRFGGRLCGWGYLEGLEGINPPAGVTASASCDKTLDGPNGCVFHGGLYTAAGHDSFWPLRWGGFAAIPARSGP